MTGNEVVNIAADLLGYSRTDVSKLDMTLVKNLVNAVYSDLFYINNKSGFQRLNNLGEEIDLNERILNDVMPYGVAMHLAESQNDGENQQVFSYKYNQKRLTLTKKSSIKDILPTPI